MEDTKKKQNQEKLLNAGLAGAAYETVQKYGSAAKEHYVAYSGVDNETGKELVKGLKQIAEEKINSDYEFQNIHQQSGFSAEVKEVARTNAENIINNNPNRKVRTDDIGRVNDPLYDTVTLDSDGNIIDGSGTQIKFLGASENDPTGKDNAFRALEKLESKKFQKYIDNDVKIEVPQDQYDDIISEANNKIDSLKKQLENQKNAGKEEQANKIQKEIDKLKTIKKNLRKSKVTSKEAVFARLHPELSTAVDIAKVSNKAGLQNAKLSGAIGGSVSIVRNLVLVCKGEEEAEEAVKNVAKDTASSVAMGYGTGFVGTALKGAMQNSNSTYIRTISKTNIAGIVVSVSVSATKTLTKYFKGEIDGVECLEMLGEDGTGMIASAMFTVIGQIALPIPVVGGLIGGMVGYALSSASYRVLTDSLKEEKISKENRERIEKECEEHIKLIREYRTEIDKIVSEYLTDYMDEFRNSFSGIKNALEIGDVDWVIEGSNRITESFGGEIQFSNMNEFNEKMLNGKTFIL